MTTIPVRSASALLSAIRNPNYGRGDVIDATAVGGNNRVPSGVYDGGGVTVRTNTRKQEFLRLEQSGTTLRNFTLEGDKTEAVRSRGLWDYRDGASAWATAAEGIGIRTSGALVENVSCHGWTHAGIKVGANNAARYTPTIRNCDLSENNCRALGYGIVIYSGYPTIEWCWFDNNRHDVAGGGAANCGYEFRHNHVGPRGRLYGTEVHSPGGQSVNIHHNTFERKRNPGGADRRLVVNRGMPRETCYVRNNWFKTPSQSAIYHFAGNSASRYRRENNHYGPARPPSGVGQPARPDDSDSGDDDESTAPDSTVPPWDWPEHVRARRQAIAQQVRPTVAAFGSLRETTTNR
jgi:hypothetical protein